jgi:prophage maintenance system killer protein
MGGVAAGYPHAVYPLIYVDRLSWRELVAGTDAIDADAIDEVVGPLVREAASWSVERGRRHPLDHDTTPPASVQREREHLAIALERGLVARFGPWASGFVWSATEPGGGGLVTQWCCAADSLRLRDEASVVWSIEKVRAALLDWHHVLRELDRRFVTLETGVAGLDLARAAERAAPELAAFVAARTDASDAWYRTFATVLRWFLERLGHRSAAITHAIHEVSSGVFSSWCAPSDEDVGEVAARLADALAPHAAKDAQSADALAQWLEIRSRAFRSPIRAPRREPVLHDGHLAYVVSRDRARDPARADRMLAAIDAVRASADAAEALTLERLAAWTSLALGEAACLRTSDAFAKAGRERYGRPSRQTTAIERALADARTRETPTVRAARVYLDVCFFHPFDDGNARAARLALDHVLTSAGLALHVADPVFALARAADDEGAWWLAQVLAQLVGDRPRASGEAPGSPDVPR